MKNTGIHALAQHLQAQGRGRDTILAHIMPEEAAMLKRMGGSGTVNPRTGLLEFQNPGDIAGGGFGSGNIGGGSSPSTGGGGAANPGDIAGGGFGSGNIGGGSSTGGGGGGGGMLGGPNAGGNAGGMQTGGGGGSLAAGRAADIASVPGYAASGNSSSNYAQSLGVPTIVANAAQNIAGAAGQSLLNFSDWATGQYRQMMSPAVSFPARPDLQEVASAAPTTQSNIDPITGRDYGLEATRRSIAWGELIGGGISSLRDALSAPQGTAPTTPGFRSEAASGVYDFTPAAPNVPTMVDPGGSGRMVSPSEAELFNEMQRERFADQYGTQPSGIPAPQPVESIRLDQGALYRGAEENRSPTEQIAAPQATYDLGVGPYDFSALQTQPLPGTVYGPVTAFGVTPGTVSPTQSIVSTDRLVDAVRSWAPFLTSGMSNEAIKEGIIGGLPEGMAFDPRTNTVINNTGMPLDEAIQTLAGSTVQQFNQDVPISQFISPVRTAPVSDFSVAAGPTFTSEVAQNVAQSLDNEFENLTKPASAVEMPSEPAAQPAINLPTFAQVPLGSPMAFPETGAAAPTYDTQPAAPAGIIDYTTERLTDPRMQPANLRSAIENASLYYGMGYPSLVNMQVTPAGAAGMLANIQRESSFDPTAYNPAEFGFGFAQYQRTRLEPFLSAMGIDMNSLPTNKVERAAAIRSALANTDTQQIGYMLNEIATTKYYAPTYRQLTQGTSPSQAATTYMRNFEGAAMVPERVAAQAANAERMARTQFAGTQLSPTVTRAVQTSGLTSPQTTQAAIQNGELGAVLDEGWKQVLAALYPETEADLSAVTAVPVAQDLFEDTEAPSYVGGSGGGGSRPSYGRPSRPGELPIEEPPVPVYTTGMNLARQTYTPRLPSETLSPAYP